MSRVKQQFRSNLKGWFLLLIALLLSTEIGYAQQPTFRHLTIDDGLSQNAAFSILQDSRGFGVSVQFVRGQCVRGMPAKTYNPDEKRDAGYRSWIEYYQ